MKRKRSIASILVAASLLLSSSVTASAASFADADLKGETRDVDGLIVEELTPVDLSGVDPSNIIELPQSEVEMFADDLEPSQQLSPESEEPEIDLADLEMAESLEKYLVEENSNARITSPYQLFTTSDVFPENKTQQAYTISVPNGDIIQAELQVPKNLSLDYNLFLFELDEAQSQLLQVSGSIYSTNSNFMPESVGAINDSGSTLTYVIVIDSKGNPSLTDYYTLNVSMGGKYDSLEPNENAFFPVKFPNMTSATSVTVPGNLNTPIDNDWFELYFENTSEFAGLEITEIPETVVVESYIATNGNLMTKTGTSQNGSVLPIQPGYNYFRICSNRNGVFAPKDYNIKFSPALTPRKMITLIAVDGYCQRYTNLFDDRRNRALITRGSKIEVRTLYYSADGIPVKTSDRVEVEIENPAWDNINMKYERGESSITNANSCSVFLDAPTLRASNYDLVYTTIYSQKFGYVGNRVQMALVDHYYDRETDRPCQHNGTCGLK